ncbi:MAG: hypothetical protein K9M11_01790 [Candidatus Pacebacteria bacterium]|nr:hypothetical protein [Candidatus Paceibacterota bacterium]
MPIELLHNNRGSFSELERFLHPTIVTQTFMLNPFELLCEEGLLPAGSYLSEDPMFFSMDDGLATQKMSESIGNSTLSKIAIDAFSHQRPERVLDQLIIKKRLVNKPIPISVFNDCVSHENALPRHVLIALLSRLNPIKRDTNQPFALLGGENVIPVMRNDGCLGRCLASSPSVGNGKWIVMLDKKDENITHIPVGRTLILRSRMASVHFPQSPWF